MDETRYHRYLPTETTVLYANAARAYKVASYMPICSVSITVTVDIRYRWIGYYLLPTDRAGSVKFALIQNSLLDWY